jgi:hypothetical protein
MRKMTSFMLFCKTLSVALAFSLMCSAVAQNILSRPGLIQTKFTNVNSLNSVMEKEADTGLIGERVLGAVMADVYVSSESAADTTTYINPITGNAWNWEQRNSGFAYTGQMYMEEGVTYTFGKSLDDGASISLNGESVILNTKYNDFAIGQYTTDETGWVDIDIRIHDGAGGKGPYSTSWDRDMGLAFNTTEHVSITPKSAWQRMIDPGDGSLFRTAIYLTETEPCFIDAPEVTLTSTGYLFSVELVNGQGDLYAVFGTPGNYESTNLIASGISAPYAAKVILDIPTNTAFAVAGYSQNEFGETALIEQAGEEIYFSGEVRLEFIQNACEENYVQGIVRVHREDIPESTRLPLVVNFSAIEGTAIEGAHYEPLSGNVVIPSDAAFADIFVIPIFDATTSTDTKLDIVLEEGNYFIGSDSTVAIVIENSDPPTDKNVWIGSGNASEATNWTQGVPTSDSDILLSIFSSADMVWDAGVNGLPDSVATWTQDEEYSGTVSIRTTYPEYDVGFTNFIITGDADIAGGILAPVSHGTSKEQRFRLMVTVGGNFFVGSQATISASGKGRYTDFGNWKNSAPHGGNSSAAAFSAFGSIRTPVSTGWGSCAGTGGSRVSNGGGAIKINVSGDFINNGTISTDGGINHEAAGAGGSIFIKAANILGTGSFSAKGTRGTKSDGCSAAGAGGRISLNCTGINEIPIERIDASGIREGWNTRTGAGTIYMQSAESRVVYVKNYQNTNNEITTPIPAEDDPDNWGHAADTDLEGSICAHIYVSRDLRIGNITIDATSDLDLAGHTVRCDSLTIDDQSFAPGIYGANDFSSGILDSSEKLDGRIIIISHGTFLQVR